MISPQFNASNISTAGVCPSPGTAIAASPQTRGIASVASALEVAVPETGTLRSRSWPANSPQPLRGCSATFIKLQKIRFSRLEIGFGYSISRRLSTRLPFSISGFQLFSIFRLSICGYLRPSTPKINFKKCAP
jgi:hypothetical protein